MKFLFPNFRVVFLPFVYPDSESIERASLQVAAYLELGGAMSEEKTKGKKKEKETDGGTAAVTLPATVEKIIPPSFPSDPEKAQVAVEGADHLYRELRVENKLTTDTGTDVRLKPGAHVEVTIEADRDAVTRKKGAKESN